MADINKEICALEDRIADLSSKSSSILHSTPHYGHTQGRFSDSGIGSKRKSDTLASGQSPQSGALADDQDVAATSSHDSWINKGARPKVRTTKPDTADPLDTIDAIRQRIQTARNRPPSPPLVRPSPGPTSINIDTADKSKLSFKPDKFDGTHSWLDYHSHFEACAEINGWSLHQKGLYLAGSLQGQARGVLGNLPRGTQPDYLTLVKALEERFSPPSQTDLYRVQFRERRQRAGETLPELGQAMNRLVHMAFPSAPDEVKETLATDQFINALADSDVRIRIKQAHPKDLNDAVRLAVELDAYNQAEKQSSVRATRHEETLDNFKTLLTDLSKKVDNLQKTQFVPQRMHETGPDTPTQKERKTCYYCKKPGHFRRDCRKLKRKLEHDAKKENRLSKGEAANPIKNIKTSTSVGSIHKETGIFVDALVAGTKIRFLVDTGASLSLLSSAKIGDIPLTSVRKLEDVQQKVLDAGGNRLNTIGKGYFNISLGNVQTDLEFVVADISVEGILGMDFLQKNDCVIDIVKRKLILKEDIAVPLEFLGSFGCFRVISTDTTSIPPQSEVLIKGKVCTKDNLQLQLQDSLLEPNESFIRKTDTFIGRSLVSAQEVVPVRILNLSDDTKVVYKGTYLADISPVCTLQSGASNTSKTNLTKELDSLLQRSSQYLDANQQQVARNFLSEYQHLFAKDNMDLGETNVVQHDINTGNAHPIKQPIRRVPVHLAEETNKQLDQMLEKGIIEPSQVPGHPQLYL